MTGTARGNILFVTLDQWRGDCLSAAGHSCLKTPVFDRLAGDSVLFRRHYAQASPCGPSRASLLTGMYLQNHRSGRNGTPLDSRHTNVALEARKAGHHPVVFGYTDTSADPRGQDPADPMLQSYEWVPPGLDEALRLTDDLGPWLAWLKARGYDVPAPDVPPFEIFRGTGGGQGPTFAPPVYKAEHSQAAFITDKAIEYLEGRRGAPWFVHISYLQPHPPFVAPEPYNARYHPDEVPAPRRGESHAAEAGLHPWLEWRYGQLRGNGWSIGKSLCPTEMTEIELRQLRATYYGMINEVEDNIARLLDWLRANGRYDDTLIVITSDHGEQLGDHWMLGKESYFDESFHVPLILRDPWREAESARGRHVEAFTESIDIMPTILDWLGLTVPRQCDGASLLPWLHAETPADWREAAHWELDFRNVRKQGAETALGLRSDECGMNVIRDERYKYVHFEALPPLFFDLDKDPLQQENRAGDADYAPLVLRYAQKMLSWRMANDERVLTHMHVDKGVLEQPDARHASRGKRP